MKWLFVIAVLTVIAALGGELAAIFVGLPASFAILWGSMMIMEKVLAIDPTRENGWKTVVFGIGMIATVLFVFWLMSLTGWWG